MSVPEITRLLLTLYTLEEADQWMRTPCPLLDGECALDLIEQGKEQLVLHVVRYLVDDVFV